VQCITGLFSSLTNIAGCGIAPFGTAPNRPYDHADQYFNQFHASESMPLRPNMVAFPKEQHMNKNQIKGMARQAAGEVQEKIGKLLGSKRQQAKGLQRQISGNAEKNLGNAKELIRNAVKSADL
jgi:uncharacterized protein YjbJ (UPF0337 family)